MLDYVRLQWQAGERRLSQLAPGVRRPFDRVIDVLVAELRRRLGSTFSTQELVDLYEGSGSWTMALAVEVAPDEPAAWEHWVADAAFNRYMRDAADWPQPR